MKLYVDTNTYLSFISPISDIKSLEKLKGLIEQEKVELVLPSQTKQEFLRHFKNRVAERREKLQKGGTQYTIPNQLKSAKKKKYTEQEKEIIKQIDSLNASLKKHRKQEISDLRAHTKAVEKLIGEIFKLATFFEYTDEVVLRAVLRYAKDLPPKKNDHKFGDAINWETLKENIRGEGMVIVSTDPDFIEGDKKKQKEGKKTVISKILASEWKKHTKKEVILYQTLGQFVNTIDKKNKVSKEVIKREMIQAGLLESAAVIGGGSLDSVISSLDIFDPVSAVSAVDHNRLSPLASVTRANFSVGRNTITGLRNIERAFDIAGAALCKRCQLYFPLDATASGSNGLCEACSRNDELLNMSSR